MWIAANVAFTFITMIMEMGVVMPHMHREGETEGLCHDRCRPRAKVGTIVRRRSAPEV